MPLLRILFVIFQKLREHGFKKNLFELLVRSCCQNLAGHSRNTKDSVIPRLLTTMKIDYSTFHGTFQWGWIFPCLFNNDVNQGFYSESTSQNFDNVCSEAIPVQFSILVDCPIKLDMSGDLDVNLTSDLSDMSKRGFTSAGILSRHVVSKSF